MKLKTTKKGVSTSKAELERKWLQCWNQLDQERIQRWIERIPIYIKEIIRLDGGNEYMEGSKGVSWRNKWRNGDSLRDEELE